MDNRKELIQLLQEFDWEYDRCEDYDRWLRGDRAMQQIQLLVAEVEDGVQLWNVYAPLERKRLTYLEKYFFCMQKVAMLPKDHEDQAYYLEKLELYARRCNDENQAITETC